MKSLKLHNVIPFTILPVTIFSILPFSNIPGNFIFNTTFWWITQAFIIYVFWLSKKYFFDKSNEQKIMVILWYIWWNIFSIIRGYFIAEDYWDWKGLIGTTFALLLPIVAYTATNKKIMQSILSFFIKYLLPLFLILAFLMAKGAYGFYLAPISFLLLFLPILTFRWKIIMVIIAIVVITADMSARSNVIKFGVPILLSLGYYLRLLIPNRIFELLRNLIIITPFLLFGLGITGIYNVFSMDQFSDGDYVEVKTNEDGDIIEEDLTADTRTFIYVEVLQTAQKYNSWWIGRSPARGYESETFGEGDLSDRGERGSSEVGILNIFNWTGIIGILLFLIVFYKASYLAVNQSNNIFHKLLGLFIAFQWTYSWVENGNFFNLSTFILWLMIGVCFSKSFRSMTNDEIKHWIWGIFDKRYVATDNA